MVLNATEWDARFLNKEKEGNTERQLILARKGMQNINPFGNTGAEETAADASEDQLKLSVCHKSVAKFDLLLWCPSNISLPAATRPQNLRKFIEEARQQLRSMIASVVADLARTETAEVMHRSSSCKSGPSIIFMHEVDFVSPFQRKQEAGLPSLSALGTSLVPAQTESIRVNAFNTVIENIYSLQLAGSNSIIAGKMVQTGNSNVERQVRGLLALYSEGRRCERWILAAKEALDEAEIIGLMMKDAMESVAAHDRSVKARRENEAEMEKASGIFKTFYQTAAAAHSSDAEHYAASTKAQTYSVQSDAAQLRALRDVDYVAKSIAEAMRQMLHRYIEAEAKRFKSHASALKECAKLTEPQVDETKKGGLLAMMCAPAKELTSEAL